MLTNPSPKSVLKKYPAGNIWQLFGENREDYIIPKNGGYEGHPGIDVTAYDNAPLVAVCDGVIQEIAEDPFRLGGKAVWLYANGVRYGYGHCKEILKKKGDTVKEGELIATMGNTGFVMSENDKGIIESFWGNAPAGRGVHCHFSKMFVKMNGDTPNILNWDNGYKGFVDPLPDFVQGSIKPPFPYPTSEATFISLLQQFAGLLRSKIRLLGGTPVN